MRSFRGYSRSRSPSHSHSPHSQRHDYVHHSPKRGPKSPLRTTSKSSKHTSHVSRVVSPHNSRLLKKSSHTRPKHSRSPSKYIHNSSRSSSPIKDSRTAKKNSSSVSPESCSSVSKKKKETKSPEKQYIPKVKLSETSLFAELVKDRQKRELAMKCLTQKNTKDIDENEVVEIHDSDDNEQNNSDEKDLNTRLLNSISDAVDSCTVVENCENNSQNSKPELEASGIKSVTSSISDIARTISVDNQSPSLSKEEFQINGVDNFVEPIPPSSPIISPLISPPDLSMLEEIQMREPITKLALPMPPDYPMLNELSPESNFKSTRKSIKDLPLPPGEFAYIYSIT